MQKKYIETRLSADDDITNLNKTYKIKGGNPLKKIQMNRCEAGSAIYQSPGRGFQV